MFLLKDTAIEMIRDLQKEVYLGEDKPLIPDGTLKTLMLKQVADLLGHTTSEITEIYYVKRDNNKLSGLTDSFNI